MFNPTHEQQTIVEAARSTTDNLLVSALAGAAKTSTLVLVAKALPATPTLCLAFNKRIAVEMQDRLPGNCTAMTLNSLGHRVWAQALGKRLRVDAKKNYTILKGLVDELPRAEKDEAYATFADTLRAIEFGKSCGYVPSGKYDDAKRLMGDEEFFAHLEEEPTRLQERLIRAASTASLQQAWTGLIDFDDQILMPTIFPASFHQYPPVLVDEAQDLSLLNHATLKKLARKRLIAVGDAAQSIYQFRGASADSMDRLKADFNMRELVLSISFRCPQAVVREARWRAPHMQWPEWAIQGSVEHLDQWSASDLPDKATILCRNNAPIFAMAIKLLQVGRYPQIVGNDIGKMLVRTLKKLGDERLKLNAVLEAIDRWEEDKLRRSRSPRRVADQAECLRIFAHQGADLGEAIAYAEHVLTAKGPIILSTVHKSKGLEWPTVFILDRSLIRVDEQQDANLLYVAITRAQERLVYVTSEGFRCDHS